MTETEPNYGGAFSSEYELHTGDPRQDLAYERQMSAAYSDTSFDRYDRSPTTRYAVPEPVKDFVAYFHQCVLQRNVFEIKNLYEVEFEIRTERFYKTNPWPVAEAIAPVVGNDRVFLTLYKELYYRHIYAKVAGGPSIEQRFESYYNYCDLFNYILSSPGPVLLVLPDQWLWDIIDEFIYQFQSFSQYKCRLSKKTDEEVDQLRREVTVWNVHSVLNVLHSLIDKSNINRQLEIYAKGGDPESVAGDFGRHVLYKQLGYFSLIGLLRLHSLLGDYYSAVKTLDNIELSKKTMYSRVPACQITTSYYLGFCYMMMRRYNDAIRTFTSILLFLQRIKNLFEASTMQNEAIRKMNDQMYSLLAIVISLHPVPIEESVNTALKEKNGERMVKMQKGDVAEFESAFAFACPKFLSPVPPNYETTMKDYHMEPFQLQLKAFLDEVNQQIMIPTIRSFLKLYTTMPISKLANFLNMDEDKFRSCLLCFKHKMKNLVWQDGSALTGEFQSSSELDFYIDKEMIHIADTKVERRYGDYFIEQIQKLDELNKSLKPK